ncbi:MAG: DUF4394 domain-containing protein [Longimicrobiales bacterium]
MKRALLALAAAAAILSACDDDDDLTGLDQLVGRRIYAVDVDNNLILFGSGNPGTISNSTPITGLAAGELVVGIDFRPTVTPGSDSTKLGALYGLTSASRLVTIDTATAVATVVGSLDTGSGPFILSGTFFGVDFNPTVDRLRVHSDTRQNLRLNPNTSPVIVIVDTDLAFVAGDANETATASVVANAYTFAVFGGTTSLLTIDSGVDVIALSGNPNAGTLATIAALPINAGGNAGFDIASDGTAVVALAGAATRSNFYTVTGLPTSATFTLVGTVDTVLRALAIAP